MRLHVHVRGSFQDPGNQGSAGGRSRAIKGALAALAVVVLLSVVGTGVALAGASNRQTARLAAPSCTSKFGAFATHLTGTPGPVAAPSLSRLGITLRAASRRLPAGVSIVSRDVCSAGTIHSINVFLDRQMRKLGFRFSTPPLFLQRDCSATSMSWWRQRGSSFQLFSWHFTGKAGQGQFWRFTFCDPHR